MEGFRRHMTPGGHALKHACIMRIKLRRSTSDKVESVVNGEKMVVGFKVFASVIKNQMAAEGRTAWWWFYNVPTPEYGFGIDTLDEVIRLAVATKVVTQAGSWYSHPALPEYKASGEHKVQGQKGLAEAISADPSVKSTIVSETMAVLKTDGSLASEIAPFDPGAVEEDVEV
jgi:recombination protein RecA